MAMLSYLWIGNAKGERPQTLELIVVLAVVIIIFGIGRLPRIGGALGKSIREFRGASRDGTENTPTVGKAKPSISAIPARDAFCTRCGAAISPNVRFCTACGYPVQATGS